MLAEQFKALIDRVVHFIEGDLRFAGAAIGGSYITKTMDKFSDLDFILVSQDDCYQEVMEERFGIVEQFGNLLSAFIGDHVGEPRLIICLYDNPIIHMDFKFVVAKDIIERVEDPVILIEKDNCISDVLSKSSSKYPVPDLQWKRIDFGYGYIMLP